MKKSYYSVRQYVRHLKKGVQMIKLRPYQEECLSVIPERGSYLIHMATGLGKTATFTSIPRKGRVLILAHREELVKQPAKYYNCPVGFEMAKYSSNGEEVVIASVQSLRNRLKRFNRSDFDMIITDEAHHAAARSYKQIYEYFKPRLHLGFTATPNRGDHVRLDDVYEDIIFSRDLKWGIENGYLCDIDCMRVDIGFDISGVARRMGDYAPGELERAMNIETHNKAIAEAYRKYARGATVIFATSVQHAKDIAAEIDGAVAVTADTKDREDIIRRFTNGEIPVLVNCMIFTEGTDIPLIETIIIARPTQNESLYTQMVGRGLRLHPQKYKLRLIDCIGYAGNREMCTAPSLIGVDISNVPESRKDELQGDLFDLPDIAAGCADCPENWIRNIEFVDLWAKQQSYNTHGVNYFKMPSGELVCKIKGSKIVIPPQDELGMTVMGGVKIPMQKALDSVYMYLAEDYADQKYIWDLSVAKRWGKKPASEKQKNLLKRKGVRVDIESLTSLQASQILNRVLYA